MKPTFITNQLGPKVLQLFNIRPGEGPLVGLMLIYSLLMGVPGIITETTGYSLFLERFSAQSIPYVYIGFAVLTATLGLFFARIEAKLPLPTLFFSLLVVLAAPLIVFRLLLQFSTANWPVVGLAIWSDTVWVITSLAFWGMATHLFTLRQGKRLFGLLGAGLISSEVVSGLMIPPLVSLIGTVNLLLVAVAAVLGALLVQTYIVRVYDRHLRVQEDEPVFSQEKTWWQLLRQPYITLIFGLAALNLIVYFFIDNLFYAQAEQRYADADTLAGFIGTFFALSGLLIAIVGALVSGRFFNRHGLQTGLLVLPLVLFAGVGLTVVVSVMPLAVALLFWVVIGVKLLNEVLKDSINDAAVLILYQPLPAAQRLQVQTAVEGIIRPLAAGTAGVLLLLLSALFGMSEIHLESGLLILITGWIALAVVLARRYPHVLMQALTRRKLDGAVLTLEDGSSIATLEQALRYPHPGVVLYALRMLHVNRPEMVVSVLPGLLTHPAVEVRLEALRKIEQLNLTTAVDAVERCFNQDESVRVRASAMRTFVAIDTIRALGQIFPYLDAQDLALQLAAMICVIGYGNPELAKVAEDRLFQQVVSTDSTDRIKAARILGAIRTRDLHHLLLQLLQDDDVSVRRAALVAAGQARYPQLWPAVVATVASPGTRTPAASALTAGGDLSIPAISAAFDQPHIGLLALIRLARVTGRIGGPQATALLLQHVDTRHEALRTAILAGLDRGKFQVGDQDQARLIGQIDLEVDQATWLLAALNDLAQPSSADDTAPALKFLNTVLLTQLTRTKDRIFSLLSFLYGEHDLRKVKDNLGATSAHQQAYAWEILDTILSSSLKQRIFPLLRPLSYSQQLEHLQPIFPQEQLNWQNRLVGLLNQSSRRIDDPWLWTCAAHTIGALWPLNLDSNADLIEGIAAKLPPGNNDRLMTETAIWTLTRMITGESLTAQWSRLVDTFRLVQPSRNGGKSMLSTLEKVIFLKSVNLFKETADEILAQVAMLLEEVEFPAGVTIFEKGSPGDCMYIIVSGQLEVYDGNRLLNPLGEGDVFGEMALLDSRTRMASVVAVTDAHLLRLGQEPFYELMEDHIEVARGVIFVLSGYLRNLLDKVSQSESQPAL